MSDLSELIIDVKNDKALSSISAIGNKLDDLASKGKTIGETLFAGWSLSKVIDTIGKFGEAHKNLITQTKLYSNIFGQFTKSANAGVRDLIRNFNETERSAKKLMGSIGSRIDFDLPKEKIGEMASAIAKITENMAMATGNNVVEISKRLTSALYGEVDGLKEMGLFIDKNSERFQALIDEQMKFTGATEKAATALVIFNELQDKAERKFGGIFGEQINSISQILGDIKNTLESGMFAKAGEYLATIIGPALKSFNDILSMPIVQKIGGIILSLGLVALGFKSINMLSGITINRMESSFKSLFGSMKKGDADLAFLNEVIEKTGLSAKTAAELINQANDELGKANRARWGRNLIQIRSIFCF